MYSHILFFGFHFSPNRKKEEEESTHANIKERSRQAHTQIYKDHKTTSFDRK